MIRHVIVLCCVLWTWPALAIAGQGQPPAIDLQGDPLPAGALARLGSVRFRHDANIVFAAFLPDTQGILSVSTDGVICRWEWPSGKRLSRVEGHPADQQAAGKAAVVTRAMLSPSGQRLVVFSRDGVSTWDWAKGERLATVPTSALTSSHPMGPAYSPDGKIMMLVGGSRVLQFVDITTGKEISPSVGRGEALTSISFGAGGEQVVTRDAKSIQTWEAATGKFLGSTLISASAGAAGKSTAKGSPSGFMLGTTALLSPDGKFELNVARFATPAMAQAAQSRDAVIMDTATGKELGKIGLEVDIAPMHRKALLFSPDSKVLAAVAGDAKPRVDLFELPTGKLLRSLEIGQAQAKAAPAPGRAPAKANPPPGAAVPMAAVPLAAGIKAAAQHKIAFSPDGKALIFQSNPGSPLVVLDTATGKQLGTLPAIQVNLDAQTVFSPDGRCLFLDMNDGTLTLCELATGQIRRTFGAKLPPVSSEAATRRALADMLDDPLGASSPVQHSHARAVISPDTKLLALAGAGGTVHIWDILTGKELAVFKGHTATVNALAFAPHGRTLASASEDATALIWDMTKVLRPAKGAVSPKQVDLEKWWQAMADNDAARAFDAMADFVQAPEQAVAWIKDHVKPAAALDQQRCADLIAKLDDNQYKVREVATSDLHIMGEQVVPLLEQALAKSPTQEARTRLESIHGKLTSLVLQGERLRAYRAVELLDMMDTPAARQYLEALADGAPAALVTESARAALKR